MSEQDKVVDKFGSCFCDECKQKTSEFFSTHKMWVILKPKKLQVEMAKLICKKCRRKAKKRMGINK